MNEEAKTPKQWRRMIDRALDSDPRMALNLSDQALGQYPDASLLLASRGCALNALGRLEESIDPLAEGLRRSPEHLRARIALIRSYLALGRYEPCIPLIEPVSLDGVHPNLIAEWARLLQYDLADRLGAVAAFALASAAKPSAKLIAEHDKALAEAAADTRTGISPGVRPLYRRALGALAAGDAAAAERMFMQVVEACPHFAPGWVGLKGARTVMAGSAGAHGVAKAWLAASPTSKVVIKAAMRRPLSARGLVFDPRDAFPMRPMREVLQQVATPAELHRTPNAYLMLDPGGRKLDYSPGISLDGKGDDLVAGGFVTGPKFVASIRNAVLAGRGVPITERGELIADITLHKPEKYPATIENGQFRFPTTLFSDGLCEVRYYDTPAFLVAGPTDKTFGDWMNSFPTRLALAQAVQLDCPIVVRAGLQPNFLDMLLALGVKRDKVISQDLRSVSVFPKLYVTSWPWTRRSPMEGLYDVYQQLPDKPSRWDGAFIYLSRRNIRYRPLENEPEIAELFVKRGFEVVCPEELDFATTAELFSRPACVAGPFGSAFHNLVLSKVKPVCFTIRPPFYDERWDEVMAWFGMLGVSVAYVTGEADLDDRSSLQPWSVSPEAVERGLDQVMTRLRAPPV